MSAIRDINNNMIYCGDEIIQVKDFLLIAKYLEQEVFVATAHKKIVIVMPDGLTQACYLLYCLQKYEVLPLTNTYLVSEYEGILKSFNPDIVISIANNNHTSIKEACSAQEIQLLDVTKLEDVLSEIRLKYKENALDLSLLELNQGKLILFTSGTTGKPKQVVLTWSNILASIRNISNSYNLNSSDICLNIMPMYHIHGIVACFLTSIYSGGQIVILENGFDVIKFFTNLKRFKPSWYSGVPTMHQSIAARVISKYAGVIEHSLRFIRSSSSGLPEKVNKDLFELFKVPIYQAYGMTEACHQISSQIISRGSSIQSVGFGVNVAIEIRDDNGNKLPLNTTGNIWIKGENLFSNYFNLTKEESGFSPDGYFNTGDIGFLDNDEALVIVSRSKEMINKGGEKIAPQEIENIVLSHPFVENAVCFSIEDEYYGEDVGLAIVLKANKKCSVESIKEYMSNFVNDFKIPKEIFFIDSIPKGKTGKLQRIGLDKILKAANKLPQNNETGTNKLNQEQIETSLISIWQKVLQLDNIKPDDDFFRLGGDSILAISIINLINKELLPNNLKLKYTEILKNKSIKNLAIEISKLSKNDKSDSTIKPYNFKQNEEYKLSYAQNRLWFINNLELGTNVYNVPIILKLSSTVNQEYILQAINEVVNRHEILRTIICHNLEDEPYQKVLEAKAKDYIQTNTYKNKQELDGKIKDQIKYVFKLDKEIPIRVFLYIPKSSATDDLYLLILIHHIAADGWSRDIMFKEINTLYHYYIAQAKDAATIFPLKKMTIQYKDYALWQREYLTGDLLSKQMSYWQNELLGYENLNLTTDRPRALKMDYAGDNVYFELDENLSQQLREISKRLGVSLYCVMLGGYYLLLSIYSNQDDIVIGTPVANRHHEGLDDLIGFFVNTLVLRFKLDKSKSIIEYLTAIGEKLILAQSNQDLPFEKLVREVRVVNDESRNPIFQVMFGLQNFEKNINAPDSLFAHDYELDTYNYSIDNGAKFDLTTMINDDSEKLCGTFNYATSLFNQETIEHFINTYKHILQEIAHLDANSEIKLSELTYLTQEEYKKQIYTWNNTKRDYPQDKTIYQLFEEQVVKTPDNIAVVYEDRELSYQELNRRSNQLAHYLRSKYDLHGDDLIALCLDRSEYMIISILGVLKAGCAYVPIDPSYPGGRISYILDDTKAKFLLVNEVNEDKIKEITKKYVVINSEGVSDELVVQSQANPKVNITSKNLAYVIYTSGTTGKPKGVMIQHQGVNSLVNSFKSDININKFNTLRRC